MMSHGVVINWDKFYKQLWSILMDDYEIHNIGLLFSLGGAGQFVRVPHR